MTIGFIGTGVMGASIAAHIIGAGYKVNVFNRTKSKTDKLVAMGAVWRDSPKEMTFHTQVIMTMLGYPADVRDIYLNEESGLVYNAAPGTVFIDMTTSTPTLAKEIYEKAAAKGVHAIDAPVSGGDVGAKNASLTIMCGGDEQVFNQILPILKTAGKNIQLQGPAGSGQHTKMCNQIAIAPGMLGVCEALLYAKKSGLDPQKVLASIEHGAAGSWSLSNYGPRILKEDYAPGFFVKHFIKDMKIAIDEAHKMNIKIPGLELAEKLYEQLAEMGFENDGTHALYKWYDSQA